MVKTIIEPVLRVDGTVLLGITTPNEDADNYYNTMMDAKRKDGTPMFHKVIIGLACDACVEKGIGKDCPHKRSRPPPWKSSRRNMDFNNLQTGDAALSARENLGVLAYNAQNVFSLHTVNMFAQSPRLSLKLEAGVVFCGMDPAGGGSASAFSLVSFCYENGHAIIVGIDQSTSYHSDDVASMVHQHFTNLRNHPKLRNSIYVVFIEANMSYLDADRIANELERKKQYRPIVIPSYDTTQKRRKGVWTDNPAKIAYADALSRALTSQQLACELNIIGQHAQEDIEMLIDQMKNYRRFIKSDPTKPFSTEAVTYSGKQVGKRDDLVMSLMMALHWSFKWMQSDENRVHLLELGKRVMN